MLNKFFSASNLYAQPYSSIILLPANIESIKCQKWIRNCLSAFAQYFKIHLKRYSWNPLDSKNGLKEKICLEFSILNAGENHCRKTTRLLFICKQNFRVRFSPGRNFLTYQRKSGHNPWLIFLWFIWSQCKSLDLLNSRFRLI